MDGYKILVWNLRSMWPWNQGAHLCFSFCPHILHPPPPLLLKKNQQKRSSRGLLATVTVLGLWGSKKIILSLDPQWKANRRTGGNISGVVTADKDKKISVLRGGTMPLSINGKISRVPPHHCHKSIDFFPAGRFSSQCHSYVIRPLIGGGEGLKRVDCWLLDMQCLIAYLF